MAQLIPAVSGVLKLVHKKPSTKTEYNAVMAASYEKILSGASIESLKISKEFKEDLAHYMRLVSPGKSAYQISQDSFGAFSSTLSTELSRVRKMHRRRVLEEKTKGHKKVNKIKILCK